MARSPFELAFVDKVFSPIALLTDYPGGTYPALYYKPEDAFSGQWFFKPRLSPTVGTPTFAGEASLPIRMAFDIGSLVISGSGVVIPSFLELPRPRVTHETQQSLL